jgi:hypothetical protein
MSEPSPYQELIDLLKAQREVIHEGRELLQDLRATVKEAREYTGSEEIAKRINDTVKKGLEEYAEALNTAINQATEAVWNRFDVLMDIAMGEDPESVRKGNKTTEELLREYIRTKNLPFDLVVSTAADIQTQEVPAAFRRK